MGQQTFLEFPLYYELHDNVVTAIITKTLPQNSFVSGYAQIAALRPSTGDSKSWYKTFTCGRRSGAAILGTVLDIYTPFGDVGASTWDVTIVASVNDVQIRAAGQSLADTWWSFKIVAMLMQQ